MERAVLLGKGDMVDLEDLPATFASAGGFPVAPVGDRTLKQALAGPERQIILDVLEMNHWNRHATAESLGINRTTLYKKMKRARIGRAPPSAVRMIVGRVATGHSLLRFV